MIIVLNKQIESSDKERIVDYLKEKGFRVREIQGESDTVLGEVIPISKPYKLASREFKKEDTVIKVGGVKIGGNRFCVMGGPCAVENAEQIDAAARIVAESGGVILRGGAFKPRTSPYAFQGLRRRGTETDESGRQQIRTADCHRNRFGKTHSVNGTLRRYLPNRRAQYAEFRTAEGGRQTRQTGHAQTRTVGYHDGVADGRRIFTG